jgi:ABC-type transport system substrate-binding protein
MTMSLSRLTRLAALAAALLATLGLPAGPAGAQEKPRPGGILTWFDYGDPGRLDVHAESPLVVQQATAGVYSGLLQYDPDEPSKIITDLA